jgi:hypothetical protein
MIVKMQRRHLKPFLKICIFFFLAQLCKRKDLLPCTIQYDTLTWKETPKKCIENSEEIYQFSGYTVFAKATFKGKDDIQKQRRPSKRKDDIQKQRRHSKQLKKP